MKSFIKKSISFMLALSVVLTVASCGKEQTVNEGANAETKLGSTYPLETDETLTWATWTRSHSDYLDYRDQPFFKGLMDQTGVNIDFRFDVVGDAFNLMLASGELPDVIEYNWYALKNGPDKYIDDGVIIDLTEPIKKWAPNLSKYLEEHPDIAKDMQTDSGKYYCFPFIRGSKDLTVFEGMMIRPDILDELGLSMPETIDEWETVLMAMKDNGIKIPLSFEGPYCKPFAYAYNVTESFYIDGDKVKFGPMEQGWKDYLTLMNKWYKLGLIDPDYGAVSRQVLLGRLSTGQVGSAAGYAASHMGAALAAGKEIDPNFTLVGVKYPVLNKGDKPEYGAGETYFNPNSGVAITSQCDNVELAVKVLDYAYSEAGHLLYNFGIEGESFEMVDGVPTYTDEIYNYDKGDITASLKRYINSVDHAPCIQDIGMYRQRLVHKEQGDAITLWADTNMEKHILPHIAFNKEEEDINSELWLDINTFVSETNMNFILGKRPISEFDDYLEELNAMGMDKILAVRQSAYDRYLAR